MKGFLIFIAVVSIIAVLLLPGLLSFLGLYFDYGGNKDFDITGKKVLIITSSTEYTPHDKKTGVILSNITIPYYHFTKCGAEIDIASIKGGDIPIEPYSTKYYTKSKYDSLIRKNVDLRYKMNHSPRVGRVNIKNYDAVYIAGGWAAVYDITEPEVIRLVEEAYRSGKVIGASGYGVLALVKANDATGRSIINSRNIATLTDKQLQELSKIHLPEVSVEQAVYAAGGYVRKNTMFKDYYASRVEVDTNAKIVTGQNQNSVEELVYSMMAFMDGK